MSCLMASLVDFWSIFAVDDDIFVSLLRMVSYFLIYFRHYSAWGMSRSYNWHPWRSIQGLSLVKSRPPKFDTLTALISWQILALSSSSSSSSHFPTTPLTGVGVNQQKNYNNKGNRFSCLTIVDSIYSYTSIFISVQNQIFNQFFLMILIQASPVRRQFKQYLVDLFVVSYEKI